MSNQNDIRPSTAASGASTAVNHVQDHKEPLPDVPHTPVGGEGESALPEDKKEEAIENLEDDWVHDPKNPRNWSFGKKWVCAYAIKSTLKAELQCYQSCIGIVSLYTFITPLGSSMMAPALPDIGIKYGM